MTFVNKSDRIHIGKFITQFEHFFKHFEQLNRCFEHFEHFSKGPKKVSKKIFAQDSVKISASELTNVLQS